MLGFALVMHKTFNTYYKPGHVERDSLHGLGSEGCPGVSVYTCPRLVLGRPSLNRHQGAHRGPHPLDWALEILLSRGPFPGQMTKRSKKFPEIIR